MRKKGDAAFGDITVDFDRMQLKRSGRTIAATAQEFRILRFFINNPECVFTRQEILRAAWPKRKRLSSRTVDNYILHLREKLEHDPSSPGYFQTVHGIGYKFVPCPEKESPPRLAGRFEAERIPDGTMNE